MADQEQQGALQQLNSCNGDANTLEVKKRRKIKNVGSRVCHSILAFLFLVVVMMAVLSSSTIIIKQKQVSVHVDGCMLYMQHERGMEVVGGSTWKCIVAKWVEMAVAVFSFTTAFWMMLKACTGLPIFTSCVIIEMLFLVLLFAVSLFVSINTTLGKMATCDILTKSDHTKSCVSSIKNQWKDLTFHDELTEAEIASWAASCMLLIIVMVWMGLSLVSCCVMCCKRKRRPDLERQPLVSN